MGNLYGETSFDQIYAFFMLLFGITTIVAFIEFAIFLLITFNLIAVLFFSPVFLGIWYGLKKEEVPYSKDLSLNKHKELKSIITEIHKKTGVKKPDHVYITPDSTVSVSGLRKKDLNIGLVALRYLNKKELMAIIAHEYGHYSGKDTVIGYWIYKINRFILIQKEVNRQAIGFDYGALVHIPTFLIFWILSAYYDLLILWHKRRREYRADAFAASVVGKQAFAEALVKYAAVSDLFESLVPHHIIHFLKEGRQIINIYDYFTPVYTNNNVDLAVDRALQYRSKWKDSHPSISERLEHLRIKNVAIEFNQNKRSLLSNAKSFEKEASVILTNQMAYWMQFVEEEEVAEQ